MTRIRTLLAALAVQAAVAAPAAMAQESITLNMVPLPSSRQQFDMTMDMKMTMALPPLADDASEQQRTNRARMQAAMPFTMRSEILQTTSTSAKAKDGAYTLDADVTTLKSEMRDGTGRAQPIPQTGPIRVSARLKDDQFESIDVRLPNAAQGMVLSKEMQDQLFNQSFDWMRRFNGKSLKVGETLEVPMDMALPTGNSKPGKMLGRYTLTSVDKGIASFDVDMRMDMRFVTPATPASGASAPSAPVEGAMNGSGKGKMALRLADRLMVSTTMTLNMGVDMGQPGQTMRMNIEMTMAGTGKALPPAKKKPATPAKPATKG